MNKYDNLLDYIKISHVARDLYHDTEHLETVANIAYNLATDNHDEYYLAGLFHDYSNKKIPNYKDDLRNALNSVDCFLETAKLERFSSLFKDEDQINFIINTIIFSTYSHNFNNIATPCNNFKIIRDADQLSSITSLNMPKWIKLYFTFGNGDSYKEFALKQIERYTNIKIYTEKAAKLYKRELLEAINFNRNML